MRDAMRQSATGMDERTYSGAGPGTERSLKYIALLLLGARYFSLFLGVAYFLWKLTEFFWTDKEATTQELLLVWLISALIPGVAWIAARWGERLARAASTAQAELMAANQRAQSEIAERQRVEAALRESKQKAERLAAESGLLADIGRIISSSPNINDVYEQFAEEVRKLIPFDRIAIALVDSNTTTIAPYVTGINVPDRLQGGVISLAGSVTGEVVRTRSSVLIHPETEDEVARRFPSLVPIFRAGLRSMMAVPLIASNKVIGVLNLQSLTPHCYDESDVALAESVAAQIAGAIANAQLHAQVEREVMERAVLAEIGRTVSTSLRVDEVYERFAAQVARLIPFDGIAVSRLEMGEGPDAQVSLIGIDATGQRREERFPLVGTLTEAVVRARSSILTQVDDASEIASQFPGLAHMLKAGFRSFMGVPLISKDQVIGTLQLGSVTANFYTERDLAILERIAVQISGAIASARLHAQVEREAAERAVLAEIGRIVSSSLDINQVYHHFAELVREFIPFDTVSVSILCPGGDSCLIAYFAGADIPGRRPGDHVPLAGTLSQAVIAARSGMIVEADEELLRRFPAIAPNLRAGMKSFLAVPLISKDRVIGILMFLSRTVGAFSAHNLAFAESIASQIAGAVASAQLHDELQRYANALARSNTDLEQFAYVASHDLQEPLRMVSSYTQLLARRYQGRLDADADEFIGYAVDGATRMQRLIADLLTYSRVSTRGRELEPVNARNVFDEAVSNLRMAIEESDASVTHDDFPIVKADGTQLAQVFQNLIGNAIKFRRPGEPPRVHVSAKLDGKEWVFSVRDNGIGIEPEFIGRLFVIFQRLHTRDEYPGTGIGLAVCKKIVERHGGRIWVESEPGRGSTFYFTIPADKG